METDIHVTKDGKFVVIHDETTDRVSLGAYNINVEKSDYSEVKDIVLPDKDGSTEKLIEMGIDFITSNILEAL